MNSGGGLLKLLTLNIVVCMNDVRLYGLKVLCCEVRVRHRSTLEKFDNYPTSTGDFWTDSLMDVGSYLLTTDFCISLAHREKS